MEETSVAPRQEKLPRRRQHSDAFKAEVAAESRQPNALINAVAKRYGISPSLVRGWMRKALASAAPSAGFVSLPVSEPSQIADIQIELRRGAAVVNVRWPAAASSDCAAWLQG